MPYLSNSILKTEYKRKALHISMIAFALLVRYLPWWGAAICALSAFVFNWIFLPMLGGEKLFRPADRKRGYPTGILLYALVLFFLFLFFPKYPYLVCGAWGLMALGDGFATFFGVTFGKHKLPWNSSKSWVGLFSFWLFGTAGCSFFIWWVGKGHGFERELFFILIASAYTAVLCGVLETIPTAMDDNFTVPFVGAISLYCLLAANYGYDSSMGEFVVSNFKTALIVNAIVVVLAYIFKTVSISGATSGFVIGTLVYSLTGYSGYLILVTFFVLASGTTKLGYGKKEKAGNAQEKGGKRGWQHALANCGVAILITPFILISLENYSTAFAVAFCAALSTAAFDTVSSEIGQLWGRKTFLIPSFKIVPRGTEGAVSLEGTLAGLLASCVIAFTGTITGFFTIFGAVAVITGAIAGTTFESIVGSRITKHSRVENEFLNFFNTLIGAVSAYAVFMLF